MLEHILHVSNVQDLTSIVMVIVNLGLGLCLLASITYLYTCTFQ